MSGLRRIELKEGFWAEPRGWGINPLEALGLEGEVIKEIHVVSMRPGSRRGDHFHRNATEWLLLPADRQGCYGAMPKPAG